MDSDSWYGNWQTKLEPIFSKVFYNYMFRRPEYDSADIRVSAKGLSLATRSLGNDVHPCLQNFSTSKFTVKSFWSWVFNIAIMIQGSEKSKITKTEHKNGLLKIYVNVTNA